MNAIEQNDFTRTLAALGALLPKPKAILIISAHWQTKGVFASSSPNPETLYDFNGFPQALYEAIYATKGAPALATYLSKTYSDVPIMLDAAMGLDHGAWSILKHLFPDGQYPALQLSLNHQFTAEQHYLFAKRLDKLRNQDVMILGSGNIVHNLRRIDWRRDAAPLEWATAFDEAIKQLLLERNHATLIRYERLGNLSLLAAPTNEHYLPMLYAIAQQQEQESIHFFYEGIQNGSISMRSFAVI